jgi:hypothetical protein
MPRTPSQPPDAPRPGPAQPGRQACPREAGRPLPDPAAVRLLAVPDSAPPYDDEALAAAASAQRPETVRPEPARPRLGNDPDHGVTPGWPSLFAQVLAETLAGSRPPGQIVPWTTQRARLNIQRLGPTLNAGQPAARQRPLVRRVVTSQPRDDVLEMTVIVGFGPRIRALAVRLERSVPDQTVPPRTAADRATRWLCTAVEAA